jgi:hypothetical protein
MNFGLGNLLRLAAGAVSVFGAVYNLGVKREIAFARREQILLRLFKVLALRPWRGVILVGFNAVRPISSRCVDNINALA